MSWPTGRIYFKTNLINTIKFDDVNNIVSFVWKGPWETKNTTKNVIKPIKLTFSDFNDYKFVKQNWI